MEEDLTEYNDGYVHQPYLEEEAVADICYKEPDGVVLEQQD